MSFLRDLDAASTPAPWTAEPIGSEGSVVYARRDHPLIANARRRVASVTGGSFDSDKADATLIATVRNALPAIAAALEQMGREHAHHHIPGTVACDGCLLLGRLERQLTGGSNALEREIEAWEARHPENRGRF